MPQELKWKYLYRCSEVLKSKKKQTQTQKLTEKHLKVYFNVPIPSHVSILEKYHNISLCISWNGPNRTPASAFDFFLISCSTIAHSPSRSGFLRLLPLCLLAALPAACCCCLSFSTLLIIFFR